MTITTPPHWSFPDITTDDAKREARKAVIKPLWDAGFSAGEIMFHFVGASRNAIIGLVTRQGWQRAPSVGKANSERKNKARRKATPNPVKPKRPVGRPRAPEAPSEPPERIDWINQERPPLAGTAPISILDLPNRNGVLCRFPVQPRGMYCGQPSGEHTYCAEHKKLAYKASPTEDD